MPVEMKVASTMAFLAVILSVSLWALPEKFEKHVFTGLYLCVVLFMLSFIVAIWRSS